MRLFAALLPPAAVLAEMGGRVRVLRALPDAERLRWTAPQGWHLTLAFYGEVDPDAVPGLRERLARAAHRHAPMELALDGGGHFGDRTLWAGVDGERTALARLAEAAGAAGRRAGVPHRETRRFHAHLTLARARRGGPRLAPFADALATFRSAGWRHGRLTLVRSEPPPAGVPGEQPRYGPEAEWQLGG